MQEIPGSFRSTLRNFRSINFRVDSILKHSVLHFGIKIEEFQVQNPGAEETFSREVRGLKCQKIPDPESGAEEAFFSGPENFLTVGEPKLKLKISSIWI